MSVAQDFVVLNLLTVKRATLPGAPDLFRGPAAVLGDRWYAAGFSTATLTTTAIAVDTIRTLPFWSVRGGVVGALGFEVTVVGAAGSVARVGIYAADQDRVIPTTLLFDSGVIDTAAVAEFKSSPVQFALDPATLYFFVYRCGIAAPTIRTLSGSPPIFGYGVGGNQQFGFNVTGLPFGALPALYPIELASYMTNTPPWIVARFV